MIKHHKYNDTNTKPRRKNECREHEKNYVRERNHIAFSQEPKLENVQVGNRKKLTPFYKHPNKQNHGITQLYAGGKISLGKIGISL